MDENTNDAARQGGPKKEPVESGMADITELIKKVVSEVVTLQHATSAPAYKSELEDERRRREQLERRVNELVAENKQAKERAMAAERESAIRAELQKLGVTKVDLAYRAVKDDIDRLPDGRILARGSFGEVPLREYLEQFVAENPELLPARVSGGAGTAGRPTTLAFTGGTVDMEAIRPGMSPEEKERARMEILRLTGQGLKGNF